MHERRGKRVQSPPGGASQVRPTVAKWRAWLTASVVAVVALTAGCAEISTDPDVAVSIEAAVLPFPTIALGDSLRDIDGVAQPVRAIVRNSRGEALPDSAVRYLYVQQQRDSALVVDPVTGHVFARTLPAAGMVQIAARFGDALQLLIPVRVTQAPDTVFSSNTPSIRVFLPDTGAQALDGNSAEVAVRVQSRDSAGVLQNTSNWIVEFRLVKPANPTNDSLAAVFLIDVGSARPSARDTATNGDASRRVRVRPDRFALPPGRGADTVEVEAIVRVRGAPVAGAPVRILVPVGPRGDTVSTSRG